jgi:hypothetical protein
MTLLIVTLKPLIKLMYLFLGTFIKLRKAIIIFVMFIRPSFRMELGSHWTDFDEIRYLSFPKVAVKIKVSLKSDKNSGFCIRRCVYFYGNISLNYC